MLAITTLFNGHRSDSVMTKIRRTSLEILASVFEAYAAAARISAWVWLPGTARRRRVA